MADTTMHWHPRLLKTRIMASLLFSLTILLVPPPYPTGAMLSAAARPGGDIASTGSASNDDEHEYDDGDEDYGYGDEDYGDEDYGDNYDGYEDSGDEYYDDEYEIKIRLALSHHAAKSHLLVQRSLEHGGAAVAAIEIESDGKIVVSGSGDSDEEESWQVEFALEALERERKLLDEKIAKMRLSDSGDGGEYDSGDGYGVEDNGENGSDVDDDDFEYVALEDPALRDLLSTVEDKGDRKELYDDIIEEAKMKDALHPDLWFDYGYWELHAYFSCARVMAGSRPLYDWGKWSDLRQFYQQFVNNDKEEKPIPEGMPERSYQFSTDVFDPPLEPFHTSSKGRGLKAARDISKGELVFKATNNTIIFTHGHTWRKFLFAVNSRNGKPDDETTCDVLVWSWIQTLEENGPMVIVMDLDNGSLLNEGRDEPGWESPNVRCGKKGDKICLMEYYATKDIKEGDELLTDYRGFALLDAWEDMGL